MPPSAIRKAHRNRLLKTLPASDLDLLEPHFEFREFPLRQVFEEPHRPIKYVYFIEQGLASVVANGAGTRCIEVGLIGREGVTGLPVLIGGDRSPHDTYAQLAGSAHRMTANALREAMSASATLRTALLSFVHTFMVQTAQTALANGRANLEERLARWILMRVTGPTATTCRSRTSFSRSCSACGGRGSPLRSARSSGAAWFRPSAATYR